MSIRMQKNVLLDTEVARRLFWEVAESQPTFWSGADAPCVAANVTELILPSKQARQHLLRLCGADEASVSGDASDYEVFRALCDGAERLTGHALLLQSQLLLRAVLGCDLLMCPQSCDEIWRTAAQNLSTELCLAGHMDRKLGLVALCERSQEQQPAVAPEDLITTDIALLDRLVRSLESDLDTKIDGISSLYVALESLIERACTSRHVRAVDLTALADFTSPNEYEADQFLKTLRRDGVKAVEGRQCAAFRNQLLRFVGQQYQKRGATWVLSITGADMGALSQLIHYLKHANALPQTLLCVGADGSPERLATLCAELEDVQGLPRLSVCLTDWALESAEDLERRIGAYAACFGVGNLMALTLGKDALTSYAEQEYFRRVLCRWLGHGVESGIVPDDSELLDRLVRRVLTENPSRIWNME